MSSEEHPWEAFIIKHEPFNARQSSMKNESVENFIEKIKECIILISPPPQIL